MGNSPSQEEGVEVAPGRTESSTTLSAPTELAYQEIQHGWPDDGATNGAQLRSDRCAKAESVMGDAQRKTARESVIVLIMIFVWIFI